MITYYYYYPSKCTHTVHLCLRLVVNLLCIFPEGENLAAGEIYPSQTYRLQSIAVHPNFRFSPAADRSYKYLLQMKYCRYIFSCGGKILHGIDDIKMRQAIRNTIWVCLLGRNLFCTQARKKGAQ